MASTDPLFSLIRSLTANEKRYFKLYAQFRGQQSSNNYIRLFDAISQLETYEEADLKLQFEGDKIGQHFATIKYQLYRLLLRSLNQFHAVHDPEANIREEMASARLLIDRGMLQAAMKRLKMARRAAEQLNLLLLIKEIEIIEFKAIGRMPLAKKAPSPPIIRQLGEMERLNEESAWRSLRAEVLILIRRIGRVRKPEELALLEKLMEHPLRKGPQPTGFWARIFRWEIAGLVAQAKGQWEKARTEFEHIQALWNAHPAMIKAYSLMFLKYMTDLLNFSVFSGRLDVGETTLKEIGKLSKDISRLEFSIQEKLYYNEMIFLLNKGDLLHAQPRMRRIARWMERNDWKIQAGLLVNLHYNLAIFYFVSGEFSQSLTWINNMMQLSATGRRGDLQDFGKLFQLVLHIELGNQNLSEYLFRSVNRHFKKVGKKGPFEELLINAFKEVVMHYDERTAPEILGQLEEELRAFAEHNDQRNPQGLYEILFWLEARRRKMPIHQVFAEHVRARGNK